MIYDPKFDFHGAFDAAGNEIAVLDEYMMNYGNLMVFMGAQTPDCPQLDEYLEEWGIVYGEATVRDASSAVSTDGMDLIASLADDGELGSSVTQDIKAWFAAHYDCTGARPLYQPYDDKKRAGHQQRADHHAICGVYCGGWQCDDRDKSI